MKHEIEIPGLPEGWKPIAYRPVRPGERVWHMGVVEVSLCGSRASHLVVEKIKPKRIVLEDTGEFRRPAAGDYVLSSGGSFSKCNVPHAWGDTKCEIWREVKEEE
jgi:hypothetical protein